MSLLPSGEQGEGSASEKVCAYFVASLVVHIREKNFVPVPDKYWRCLFKLLFSCSTSLNLAKVIGQI